MHPARIAELLEPFLEPPSVPGSRACHSEPASAGGACPERSRKPAPSLPKEEPLTLVQLQNISTYINLLLRWNARINLTAVRDPEQIVTRHFAESLFAARHLFPGKTRVGPGASPGQAERSSAVGGTVVERRGRAALQGCVSNAGEAGASAPEGLANDQRPFLARPERSAGTSDRAAVADLGSGAGFPGLPIKLWAPDISLTLIESNHKKAAFLREVSRALILTDVNVQTARAETITDSFALVTLRAVERFAAILPVAARLVAPGGRLALLISSAQLDQARTSLLHFSWLEAKPIPLSHSRVLAVARRPGE